MIITGGIDLSIGTGMTLCARHLRRVPDRNWRPCRSWLGVLGAVLFGGLIGFVNGFNVSILGIPPFIATLAMMLVAPGPRARHLRHSTPIYFNDAPGYFAASRRATCSGSNFPNAVLVLAVAVGRSPPCCSTRPSSGATRSRSAATRRRRALSGINVRRWKIIIYTLAGLFTGIAGVMISRRGSAPPSRRRAWATSSGDRGRRHRRHVARGGKGSIVGTVIGALIISVLNNGLQIMSIPQEWQNVILGW